jgi:hypothetical protein
VFNSYGNDRLTNWKQFRNSLEESATPLEDVAEFWSHAPFVSSYLDTQNPAEWPDPWHLILDGKFDELAIALGMLYTIKLTDRFMENLCEIHMSMSQRESTPQFFLVVDNKHVLNYEPKTVVDFQSMTVKSNKIWSVTRLQ